MPVDEEGFHDQACYYSFVELHYTSVTLFDTSVESHAAVAPVRGVKGLGALVGLKVVCCGGLLLVVSGAVAATQLAWGVALLSAAAGAAIFIRHRCRCARSAGHAVDPAPPVPPRLHAAASGGPVGGPGRR